MNPIEEAAIFMRRHSLVLATAESCTAGLIASMLADIPGAGACLQCAFVVYAPQAKIDLLGVRPGTIERFNLTSEEVAKEMALGALMNSKANVALSNTGVTDDRDPSVPAGTQCFAWAFRMSGGTISTFTECRRFKGDRPRIRRDSAIHALAQIPHYFREASRRRERETGAGEA
jgi:nicotinamide-nucleotide amidase